VMLPTSSERFTLDAASLQDKTIRLNGAVLTPQAVDQLSRLTGTPASPGATMFAPATITFVVIANAGNRNCG